MIPVQREHWILSLSLCRCMLALCRCDILVHLCCELVVMVFYFGFAALCVFFTLYISCDIFVPAEKYEETSQAAQAARFCCFNLISVSVLSHHGGTDLFFIVQQWSWIYVRLISFSLSVPKYLSFSQMFLILPARPAFNHSSSFPF